MSPFNPSGTPLSTIGETQLLQSIRQWLSSVTKPSPYGIGDDCAVIPVSAGQQQIITTDAVTFGRHFDESVSAHNAGAKLIKRNLSDLAAMGGTPHHAVLALLCGSDVSFEWLKAFFDGIRHTCEAESLLIVGGDISSIAPGHFSAVLTLIGTAENVKLRNTAKVGDWLYVTGKLGGTILKKHYAFTPRLAEGQWLAQQSQCSALIDITDGLAKDLEALLPADSAASVRLDHIPIAEDAHTCAAQTGRSAIEHAFCDGEDYELLFAINGQQDPAAFEASWASRFPDLPISQIAQIVAASPQGPYINATTKEALPWTRGFEHLMHP